MADHPAPPQPWRGITAGHFTRVVNDCERQGGSVLLEPLWPIMIGLIERNCLPGNELHPAVRVLYARFVALVADEAGHISEARYAAWLAGDITVDADTRGKLAARWEQSRGGTTPNTTKEP